MKTMRLLLAGLGLCLALTLPAQDIKKPKDEFPESGMATFRLRIKSIPTLRVQINGVSVLMGVDTGCQGSAVITPRGGIPLRSHAATYRSNRDGP